ncbi:hypothetical protein [Aneurinibacillus tyrosinisolvens]|uniref:hypothetical protein n=1 Tax=Aneurinibacillus tyrosinisolvens TaxID=1443435 RepID=UPI00063FB15D|nr:hypothetical protein [Aneurinibacillus tyrosinisolvens]
MTNEERRALSNEIAEAYCRYKFGYIDKNDVIYYLIKLNEERRFKTKSLQEYIDHILNELKPSLHFTGDFLEDEGPNIVDTSIFKITAELDYPRH